MLRLGKARLPRSHKGLDFGANQEEEEEEQEEEEICREPNRRSHRKLVFRAQTMPGCAALLLFLMVLPVGSDGRRIRKRGLNHKVRLQTVRTEISSRISAGRFHSKVLESVWNSGGSVSRSCFHTSRADLWLRREVNGLASPWFK